MAHDSPNPSAVDGVSIPTEHEPLDTKQVQALAEWMDAQLAALEERYAGFVTRESWGDWLSGR